MVLIFALILTTFWHFFYLLDKATYFKHAYSALCLSEGEFAYFKISWYARVQIDSFRVSRRRREMYIVVTNVSVSVVCVSVPRITACLHYCTDPDVTWGSGRGALLLCTIGRICNRCTGLLLWQHSANAKCQRVPGWNSNDVHIMRASNYARRSAPHSVMWTALYLRSPRSHIQKQEVKKIDERPHRRGIFHWEI